MKPSRTISLFLIAISLFFSCAKKNGTSEEFRNQNKVTKGVYQKDIELFEEAIKTYYITVNEAKKTNQVINVLKVKIDTIFYGPSGKVVFLALLDKENKYIKKLNPNLKIGIQYAGECYIGINTKDSLRIIDQLKYSVTSSENMEDVAKKLRITYLREMEYIQGRYNIDDNRFWESNVWPK